MTRLIARVGELGRFVGQAVTVVVRLVGVVWRFGRGRSGRGLGLVVLVVVVRVQVGAWPAAVLGAAAGTVGLVAGLAAVDRAAAPSRARVVERGPRAAVAEVVEVGPRAAGRGVHVEFARGLAGLADWYVGECEREMQR